MSTKKEIWRLLEPMDAGEDGDQWSSDGLIWRDIDKNTPLLTIQFRRRLASLPEPQGWISVKERMPTKEDASKEGLIIWGWNDNSCVPLDWRTGIHQEPKWWRPFKFEPVPFTDPDEEAWEAYEKKENEDCGWSSDEWELCHKMFLAGRKSVMTEKEDSHE